MFAACKKEEPPPSPADHSPGVTRPAPAPSPPPEPPPTSVIPPVQQAPTGLARRCALGGDPLPTKCIGGGRGLAVAQDGLLYVVDDQQVRRYRRVDGEGCRLEPEGEPIELPPENPRPQKLDGRVYMRSGGPAWRLVRAGDAVYAHDYLGGLFRIDGGKPEPTCDDVFGYRSVAVLGKRFLVARDGIEELKLGKQCKATSAKLDDKARGDLYAIGDRLYLASGKELSRYDGKTPVKLGEGTRICFVSALTACGDGACIFDNNCMQMIQLDKDGNVLRVVDERKLFGVRPWSLAEAATGPGGEVYVLAGHRDKTDDKEICEAAVYEMPAAAFAL